MLFTSYQFLGFLAVLLLAYYLVPGKFQWPLLLAASYVFYFIAGPGYLVYILATTLTVWYAARRMGANAAQQSAWLKEHKDLSREEKKAYKEGQKRVRLRWFLVCLLLNLGILAMVKYFDFAIANLNGLFSALGAGKPLPLLGLAVPLGISFYTFQSIGYLIDVYRGTVQAEQSPFRFALFVSFFPQLIQGPISRWNDLAPSLLAEHPFDRAVLCRGLQRVLWGIFKKLVIADRVLAAVRTITGDVETYAGAYAFVGMVFYTLQLYADFTGGIDVTIGVAQAMGITVQENFNRPYFSKSLKEYWRRWHISMCSWFRDYLFYPVSVSRPMQKFTKFSRSRFGDKVGRRLPVYVSSFTVWLATGVWHGANWNFIVWGLSNWAVLMISEELEPLYQRFHRRFPAAAGNPYYRLFQVGRTFLLVCVLNIFDCYPSLAQTFRALGSIVTSRNWNVLVSGGLMKLGLTELDYGILAAGTVLMLGVSLVQRSGGIRERLAQRPYPVRFVVWYGLFLIVLLMGAYGVGYDASQFIYNQF